MGCWPQPMILRVADPHSKVGINVLIDLRFERVAAGDRKATDLGKERLGNW